MGRPATFDHLTKKKPIELRDWIVLDDDAAQTHEQAKQKLATLELGNATGAQLEQARRELADAEQLLREHAVEVVFRSIGRPSFERLRLSCPPSDEDLKAAREKGEPAPEYDVEAFAPKLISAACAEPKMTPEQVESLVTEHGWNVGEYAHLFQLALLAQQSRRLAGLGN